ncbi:MAG: DUF4143 domain-containing protein [Gammaproteobacteria bacterium]|nr:DUF4143 domain-containing protein [Gammaproteobacteria bacterium]
MTALFVTFVYNSLNETFLARDLALNHITVNKYRTLLESLFLILSIPAWQHSLGKRLIKTPKIYLGDINLLAYLLGLEPNASRQDT